MSNPASEHCGACDRHSRPLDPEEITEFLSEVPGWNVVEEEGIKRLTRTFMFDDFNKAMEFTIKVWKLAEEEGHHPAILTEWGKVTVSWWTHAIGGLHRNDIVMAAKTSTL